MANNADATASVTDTTPGNSGLSADLKFTPHAVCSTIVSEHIHTLGVKKALGIDHRDNRVIRIILLRKLDPITTLSDKEFLLAWWEVVKCKCHRALWKRGVHHRNVSPSNIMGYRFGGRFISVLNDFDLSSIIQSVSSIQDAPQGFERTGTVPFMSLHLLTRKAIAGQVEQLYYHDAESFIWVLTWICLRYENGELLRRNRPLDEWLTVDARGCHGKKASYLATADEICPTRSHEANFKVVMRCLEVIHKYSGPFTSVPADDEVIFKTWLLNHVPHNVLEGNISLIE
ncbi:hypothetical protein C8R48DRAFT_774142 [Suillus tomentosus]|nr:hypothetical protein C8R48DRAFT_774142 [Suillus tomentosus]